MERERNANSVRDERNEEIASREGLRAIGNKILAAAELPSQLEINHFRDVKSVAKIQHDLSYVANRKYQFQEDTGLTQNARRFEQTFVAGVQMGRWLGNVSGDSDFMTETFSATEYDDISQKIDAFTTLKLKESYEAQNGEEIDNLPLAFDVTVTTNAQDIHKKLTVSHNGNKALPFGFSHIDYYTDGTTKGELDLCPRYVIGVTGREAKRISWEDIRRNPLTSENLEMRFKVLAEIRAQNELFDAMLPDDAYDSNDPILKKACAYIEIADEILSKALNFCTNKLVEQRNLPNEVLVAISQDPHRKNRIIEKYFLECGQHALKMDYANQLEKGMPIVDTYGEIINYTRRLTKAVNDPTQIGTKNYNLLAPERAVKEHCTALELEK